MMKLTQKILNERPNGFTSAVVVGPRSIGKTVYTFKVAVELYMNLYDITENQAYQRALKSCLFNVNDVVNMLERHSWRNRADIIIWDDAGVYASGMMYFTNVKLFARLKGAMDTIRTCTNAFLLSTPSPKGLIGFLQSYDDYLARITKADKYNTRTATVYNRTTSPIGQRRVYTVWKDRFNCRMPDKYYEIYTTRRDEERKELVKRLKEDNSNGK